MSKNIDVKARQTSVKSFFTTKPNSIKEKPEVSSDNTTSPSIFDKYRNIVRRVCNDAESLI